MEAGECEIRIGWVFFKVWKFICPCEKSEGFLNMGREKRLDSSNLWFVFWFKKVTQEHL